MLVLDFKAARKLHFIFLLAFKSVMQTRPQQTIHKEVSFSGIGLHSGKEVFLNLVPAPEHTGILFQRTDLPGKPIIPAAVEYVQDTSRCTRIGIGTSSVQTVEHLMAAIYACEIDNLLIQVNEGEPPIADGSSLPFVELIESGGIQAQKSIAPVITLPAPLYLSHGDTHLVALPSNEFRISYTLHYPQNSVIRSQYQSLAITPQSFRSEIAPCRTFALYEEINALMERGLIRGGSLENAVIIKDGVVLSKGGKRFPDEHVRHKMLDLVGDLALMGIRLNAHVIAIRSGHMSNVALGKAIVEMLSSMQKKSSLVEKNVFHTL